MNFFEEVFCHATECGFDKTKTKHFLFSDTYSSPLQSSQDHRYIFFPHRTTSAINASILYHDNKLQSRSFLTARLVGSFSGFKHDFCQMMTLTSGKTNLEAS